MLTNWSHPSFTFLVTKRKSLPSPLPYMPYSCTSIRITECMLSIKVSKHVHSYLFHSIVPIGTLHPVFVTETPASNLPVMSPLSKYFRDFPFVNLACLAFFYMSQIIIEGHSLNCISQYNYGGICISYISFFPFFF